MKREEIHKRAMETCRKYYEEWSTGITYAELGRRHGVTDERARARCRKWERELRKREREKDADKIK